MDEPGIEIDIAALFEAEPVHGERFSIYVPNKDRNGALFSQEPWGEEALALLSKIGGGATAMPPVEGAWLNEETAELIREQPRVVYSYIIPDRFLNTATNWSDSSNAWAGKPIKAQSPSSSTAFSITSTSSPNRSDRMPKVTFSARSAKGRLRNVSERPRAGHDEFRVAFTDARPLGRVPGDKCDPLSLAAIGEVVQRTLGSSGGRPALEGADAMPMRVSLMHGDRAKIEIIASHVHPRTSPSQMVAVLCHLALAQIPEDQIVDTLSRLNGGAGRTT